MKPGELELRRMTYVLDGWRPYEEGDQWSVWGVYRADADGLPMHVADFNEKADARFFIDAENVARAVGGEV